MPFHQNFLLEVNPLDMAANLVFSQVKRSTVPFAAKVKFNFDFVALHHLLELNQSYAPSWP